MSTFLSHFSPQRSSPEDLEKILVQRAALLASSVAKLRESVLTTAKHHLLFIGPRGAGKTNLVALIHHRLQSQTDLAENLRIAWLNEDETSSSFLKLLLRIYRALAARYPAEFTLPIATEVIGHPPEVALANLERAFLAHLGAHTCVVLIENLDHLFDTMPEPELRRWRGFVQNHPVIATVGTAQRLFDGVANRDHAFFGFFDTQHLKPFSPEDARELLKKLALLGDDDSPRRELLAYLESPKGHARLNAIHHLTGGNPRLYLILADFLTTRESLDALVPAFEKMADQQLTPYYQERLRWLTPQQREIVEYLCQIQHPIVPVKTIAAALFAEHSSIAGQLKKLREMGYVVGHTRGREVYYELAEPLMRLSFQVKDAAAHGAAGPTPLRLIVDMLRVWFEQQQLEATLAALHPSAISRAYFALALAENLASGTNLCLEILRNSTDGIDPQNCTDEEFESLEALAEESNALTDLVCYAVACQKRNDHNKAIVAWSKMISHPHATPLEKAAGYWHRASWFLSEKNATAALNDLSEIIKTPGCPEYFYPGAYALRAVAFSQSENYTASLADLAALANIPKSSSFDDFMKTVGPDLAPLFLAQSILAIHTTDKPRIAEFVTLLAEFDELNNLGSALISQLPSIIAAPFTPEALDAWHAGWVTASQGHPEMDLPLRLLKTGLIYYRTQDEGELLRLPSEERKLLRQALKLPEEQGA